MSSIQNPLLLLATASEQVQGDRQPRAFDEDKENAAVLVLSSLASRPTKEPSPSPSTTGHGYGLRPRRSLAAIQPPQHSPSYVEEAEIPAGRLPPRWRGDSKVSDTPSSSPQRGFLWNFLTFVGPGRRTPEDERQKPRTLSEAGADNLESFELCIMQRNELEFSTEPVEGFLHGVPKLKHVRMDTKTFKLCTPPGQEVFVWVGESVLGRSLARAISRRSSLDDFRRPGSPAESFTESLLGIYCRSRPMSPSIDGECDRMSLYCDEFPGFYYSGFTREALKQIRRDEGSRNLPMGINLPTSFSASSLTLETVELQEQGNEDALV
ncbi:hypothetical protein NLJ89_g5187 [Agrocybe chaxingu]|uniref:Uncharacterized protein n=1 Tax=Agrocybe chaxingu TaxID=84603 RepID=A0A9W8MV89_9AGAR|nr:hypothetical protein NLJ89_g5187 [Agrocybe chaxingu]